MESVSDPVVELIHPETLECLRERLDDLLVVEHEFRDRVVSWLTARRKSDGRRFACPVSHGHEGSGNTLSDRFQYAANDLLRFVFADDISAGKAMVLNIEDWSDRDGGEFWCSHCGMNGVPEIGLCRKCRGEGLVAPQRVYRCKNYMLVEDPSGA